MKRRIHKKGRYVLTAAILVAAGASAMYGAPRKKSKAKAKAKIETSQEARKKQNAVQQEIVKTKEQIKANEASVKKNLAELGRLGGDIESGKKAVERESAKVAEITRKIDALNSRISEGESKLAKMRGEYLKAVRKMQAYRKDRSAIGFLFSSENFSQALRRLRYMREFSEWRRKQTSGIEKELVALKSQKEELAAAQAQQAQAFASQREAQTKLERRYKEQDALVANLKRNGAALQNHLAKKQAEANALKGRVAALIAEETRRAEAAEKQRKEAQKQKAKETEAGEGAKKQSAVAPEASPSEERKPDYAEVRKRTPKKGKNKKDKTKKEQTKEEPAKGEKQKTEKAKTEKPKAEPSKKLAIDASRPGASGFAAKRGALPRPVDGAFRITGRFGRQSLPDMPSVVYDNPGIDAEVAKGTAVKAVYAGKVAGVYMVPGYGTVVILNHGDYYTVYGNLSQVAVKVGDTLSEGSPVGRAGESEDDPSVGSVHFEVWKNREKLDPQNWIR